MSAAETALSVFSGGGGGSGGKDNRFSQAFPDPYLDYASTQMPRSLYDVLRWAEFIWLSYGTYKIVAQRTVRYFLTAIELLDCTDTEREKWERFLDEEMAIMDTLALSGDNVMAYGNEMISVIVPFRRYLRCPGMHKGRSCNYERPIRSCEYEWDPSALTFTGTCPNCKQRVVFERCDRETAKHEPLKIKHWPVHEMRLIHSPASDKTHYLWEIPSWFKNEITKGTRVYLEDTPWEIVQAIKDNVLFAFAEGVIFHMKEETISGVRAFGWGIPRIMGNFKQAWYIQVLKRYNMAIALDYIIPFRAITPKVSAPGNVSGDPLLGTNLNMFQAKVANMIATHRRDPTTFHFLPFPVQMELLGAEGKNLAPVELEDHATEEFLNAQGFPAELFKGTLQWQAMPVAIRLFERTWVHMCYSFNQLLNWILKRVSEIRSWERVRGRLQPPTMADDLEKKQIQLQLAAGQQISRQTAWAPFGIKFREEVKKSIQEEAFIQEQTQKAQDEAKQKTQLQQAFQMGAQGQQIDPSTGQPVQPPAPGGAPPGGAPQGGAMPPGPQAMTSPDGGQGMTPQDLMAQAESLSYQLLGMPQEQRRGELSKIKKTNPTLHAQVMASMTNVRSEAKSKGGFSMLQQMVGGQGGAQPPQG